MREKQFYELAKDICVDIKWIGDKVKKLLQNESLQASTVADVDEVRENIMLTYQHLEDARMRLDRCVGMNDPDPKIVAQIEDMTREEMARMWRNTPSGHLYFDRREPYFAIFEARFKKLGGFSPVISKAIDR